MFLLHERALERVFDDGHRGSCAFIPLDDREDVPEWPEVATTFGPS